MFSGIVEWWNELDFVSQKFIMAFVFIPLGAFLVYRLIKFVKSFKSW
ncbi:hypothetical protein GCM10025886_14050 [Tetragenococcus halophilus subsp. flandriensis]|nr:hypothetical protein GCM10025886_14050 [Tetragenococcus halophilus subsp. flandriensis]